MVVIVAYVALAYINNAEEVTVVLNNECLSGGVSRVSRDGRYNLFPDVTPDGGPETPDGRVTNEARKRRENDTKKVL